VRSDLKSVGRRAAIVAMFVSLALAQALALLQWRSYSKSDRTQFSSPSAVCTCYTCSGGIALLHQTAMRPSKWNWDLVEFGNPVEPFGGFYPRVKYTSFGIAYAVYPATIPPGSWCVWVPFLDFIFLLAAPAVIYSFGIAWRLFRAMQASPRGFPVQMASTRGERDHGEKTGA
jgi:hypothetical protein